MDPPSTGGEPHVVHVLSSFGLGGQERVALELAIGQLAAGYRVSAISLAPPPDGPIADPFRAVGVSVDRVSRSRDGLDPLLPLRLARWLHRRGVRLVHTHNPMALVYGAPAARLCGVPVVHTKHGNNPGGKRALVARRIAASCVDVFVAVSAETASAARLHGEVDEARLSIIPNGVALDRFRPDRAARRRVRAELGIAPEAWVAGTVGRLAPEKNQALLLRAIAPLLAPASRLVVVGGGALRPSLVQLAEHLRVGAFVHFVGARDDVPDVLNAFDVFVLSSDTEGLPLAIPEAMATGLPVVATRVGGVPDALEHGRTGYLVAPRSEGELRARLAALQADTAGAAACGDRARAAAIERFSAARMRSDYLDVYAGVLSRRRGRRARILRASR